MVSPPPKVMVDDDGMMMWSRRHRAHQSCWPVVRGIGMVAGIAVAMWRWRVGALVFASPVCSDGSDMIAVGCSPVNYDGTIKTRASKSKGLQEEQFKLKVLQLESIRAE